MEEFSETSSLVKSTTHPILKAIVKYKKYRSCREVIDKDLVFAGT